jgi:hypothetical protein
MQHERRGRLVAALALGTVVLVGIAVHRDYGVPVDERQLRHYGGLVAAYVNETLGHAVVPPVDVGRMTRLPEYHDRDHGSVVEVLLVAVEGALGLGFPESLFARHLTVFLLFCVGVVFVYRTLARRHGRWEAGLAGAAFMVLSPRLFADAFYNSKDVPFLAAYAAALYTALGFAERPGVTTALAHALTSALAIAIRMPGLVVPALTAIAVALRLVSIPRTERRLGAVGLALALYALATLALVVLFFPTLWEQPLANALYTIRRLGRFPWSSEVLYRGVPVKASALPWHYLPLWMLITIPPAYTFGFALGAVALVAGRLRRGVLAPLVAAERQDAFFLLAIVVPLVAVILGRSTVYDGWRHVYFVYAPFVCLAVSGYAALAAGVRDRPIVRLAVFGLLGVACVATALTTVRLHPYEMVYFNAAAGPDAGRRFDGDYWGLSYRRGLEEVLRAAGPEGEVSVVLDGESVLGNRLILPPRDRERIVWAPPASARYFVTTHRETLYDRAAFRRKYGLTDAQETWSLVVGRTHVLSVYRLR